MEGKRNGVPRSSNRIKGSGDTKGEDERHSELASTIINSHLLICDWLI